QADGRIEPHVRERPLTRPRTAAVAGGHMGCTTPPPGASAGRFIWRTPPRHPWSCSTRGRTPDRRAVPSAVIAPGPYLRVVRDPQVPARASAVPCTVIAIGAALRVPRGRERAAGAGPGPSGAALRSARGFGIPAPHATHPAPGRVYGTLTFARQTFGRLVHALVGIRAAGSGGGARTPRIAWTIETVAHRIGQRLMRG